MTLTLRPAQRADAALLARLVNMAGEDLPLTVWQGMADPGQDPWKIGASRAARDTGAFSWRNAVIAEVDGTPAGGTVSYETPARSEPPDPDTPPIFVPLIELENSAPATRYLNVIATLPEMRRRGVGQALMEDYMARPGKNGLSLIVADANATARRLYERMGFREVARRPLVAGDWITENREWVLMILPR